MRGFRKERSVRRILLGGAFAATLGVGVMLGTLIPAQSVEAQAGQIRFSGDVAVMLHFIKPGQTQAYEGVMARLKEALQKSQNEAVNRQQQAAGWKVYRSSTPDISGQGNVMYAWVIDPVLGGANYAVSAILNEVFPGEVGQIYETYNGSFTDGALTQLPINLTLVAEFAD